MCNPVVALRAVDTALPWVGGSKAAMSSSEGDRWVCTGVLGCGQVGNLAWWKRCSSCQRCDSLKRFYKQGTKPPSHRRGGATLQDFWPLPGSDGSWQVVRSRRQRRGTKPVGHRGSSQNCSGSDRSSFEGRYERGAGVDNAAAVEAASKDEDKLKAEIQELHSFIQSVQSAFDRNPCDENKAFLDEKRARLRELRAKATEGLAFPDRLRRLDGKVEEAAKRVQGIQGGATVVAKGA